MAHPSHPLRFERRSFDDPLSTELLGRFLAEIAEAFGFDPANSSPTEAEEFEPPAGAFVVGFEGDVAVACGGVRKLDEGVGEVKRMWVDPTRRGRGYSRQLLVAIEGAARAAGYQRLLLDTHGSLTAALALYRGSGYQEIGRYNDNPYAEHFFEKRLG